MANILLSIQNQMTTFTPGERKIAQFIYDNADQVLSMSAQELSQATQSSSASIVRFSRSLGLTGFPELKQHLSVALNDMSEPDLLEEVQAGESMATIKSKLQLRMENSIAETKEAVADDTLLAVADMVVHSQHLFTYGVGASSLVAQDLFQKLTRIGISTVFLQDVHLLASMVGQYGGDATVILMSNSGETSEVLKLARLAKQNGLKVIGLTSRPESTLAQLADIVLPFVSAEYTAMRTAATVSLMAQLYMNDLLFYAIVANDYDHSIELISTTRQAVNDIEGRN